MKEQCSHCRKNFKLVNQETGLCYYCFFDKHGYVAKEWQPKGKYVQ